MKLDLGLGIRPLWLALLSLLVVGGGTAKLEEAKATGETSVRTKALNAMKKQPMRFEVSGERVVGHAKGAAIALDREGATLALRAKDRTATKLSMKVHGGADVAPVAGDELPTKINRLIGDDTSKWQRNVSTYGQVTYPSVLDGVDLVFHGEDGQLEYDFVVAPGKDASKVAMDIDGGESLSLTDDGDLAIKTAKGTIVQQRPRVYQRDAHGRAHDIKASYRINSDRQIAFNVDAYDHSKPLVIDPILGYATYLGEEGADEANGIAAAANGNAYVVGSTDEFGAFHENQFLNTGGPPAQFHEIRGAAVLPPPVQNGEGPASTNDVWVAKLDSAGRVIYLTFFGGDQSDQGRAIAVDASERVYVTGYTASFNLKTTDNAAQSDLVVDPNLGPSSNQDGFLFTLNADGSDVTYSTYLDIGTNADVNTICPDGTNHTCTFYYQDFATSIAVSGGQVYIGGVTALSQALETFPPPPPPPPVPGGANMAVDDSATGPFVTSVTAPVDGTTRGVFNATHFFGGQFASLSTGVAVANGQVFVGGSIFDSQSILDTPNGFQTVAQGNTEGFVASLSTNLSTVNWFSYFGNSGTDAVTAVAALPNGHVYVTGQLGSDSCEGTCPADAIVPVNGSVQGSSDAFVAHIDENHGLVWVRRLGGSSQDSGSSIAVDPLGHAFVTGVSRSLDFPTQPLNPRDYSGNDAFVSEVAADGQSLLLSINYGSSESDDSGSGIALSATSIHICGTTTTQIQAGGGVPTQSPLWPPVNATQPNRGDANDAFIARISNTPLTLTPPESSVVPGTDIGFVASGGIGFGYKFQVITTGSGNPTVDPNTGAYTAGDELGGDVVRVTDAIGNTATANVTVISGQGSELVLSPSVTSVPPKGTIPFKATGGTQPYNFTLITNASGGNLAGTTGVYHAGPRGTVTDRVKVTDATGQTKTAIITVTDAITITPPSASLAQNEKQTFTATGGKGAPFTWAADKGAITQNGEFTAPLENIVVTITATDSLGNVGTATVAVGGAIAITPVNPNTFPKGTIQFQAIGGAGGYKFAVITSPAAGGTIGADSGLFTAGTNGGVTETVDVKDTADRHATTTVTVGPSLTITPATANPAGNSQVQFSAAGGSGAGYAFSIETSQSGASIDGASGLYTAGPNGGQDVVKLVDSVGNEARATLNVTAAPNNGSSGGSNGGTSSGTPGSNGGPGAGSSGTTNVGVGGNGNDDSGCSVSNVRSSTPSSMAWLAVGLAILVGRRRRRS